MEMIGRLNALALDNEHLVCVLKKENRNDDGMMTYNRNNLVSN